MKQDSIRIAPELKESLKQALILEGDLITLVRAAPREPLPEGESSFRVRGALPVPRLMDPETAEMRLLEIHVRALEPGDLEIYAVDGL